MHTPSSLLLGALLATTISAIPTPVSEASKPRSFTIPVVRKRSDPAGQAKRNDDGAVVAEDLDGVYGFQAPVLVGGQQLMLQIDTGSSDL